MSGQTLFYKSFDNNLCGKDGFQYVVGEMFHSNTTDEWEWLHYSQYLSSTLMYYGDMVDPARICLVEPKGKIYSYKACLNGFNRGNDYTGDKLYVTRELSRNEMFDILEKEHCPFSLTINHLKPPYEWLLKNKSKIRKLYYYHYVADRDDLTYKQKSFLLPKSAQKVLATRTSLQGDCP